MECNLLLDGQLKGRKYFGNTTVHVCVWGGGGARHPGRMALNGARSSRKKEHVTRGGKADGTRLAGSRQIGNLCQVNI